ncbi:PD-(D/E)XK nuclease family protein [Porphyromonas levii]|uniref:PD-(D/E)XK nuclease family protein n=1 Tax=Porphyromonas levii TaxID=28114 RepID=UPI001B8B79ED|nr:PD-(D/E)XK nuclease family protein [Porphyromonas levii]MBR8713639.1 hypothetical protein [Porphyromonas levii]MBR8715622.1 hypothetical protein [Porphyromonas levii]MBR8728196.1 hypothetical protein [Porphyromonas levii]MBR8736550.1 hypothetical protein [Porphyromonas levii]MBR8774363.1 hypothetical protein [Porphyromonas levii]
MKIYFSPEYVGHTYIDWGKHGDILWESVILDVVGLVSFLELHLGIYYRSETRSERIAHYHDALSKYLRECPDSIFARSFEVDGLSVAEVCLAQRDELALSGWTGEAPAPSARLETLQGIERHFDSIGLGERLTKVLKHLPSSNICQEIEIEMPVAPELLMPRVARLLRLMESMGATISITEEKLREGDSNLSRLQRLFQSDTEGKIELNLDERKSLEVLCFEDEATAVEYLLKNSGLEESVVINSNNKLFDNYLSQLRKPRTGSVISGGVPQIAQLFILGLRTLLRPLDVRYLLQWCYAPTHPLQNRFRFRLARQIAESGGYYAEEVQQVITDYLEEKFDDAEELAELSPQKRASRRKRREKQIAVFLPTREIEQRNIPLKKSSLMTFVETYIEWATVKTQLILEENEVDKVETVRLLNTTIDQANSLRIVLQSVDEDEEISATKLQSWIGNLYHEVDILQYEAEQGAIDVIATPGQLLSNSRVTTWISFYGENSLLAPCSWLTERERKELMSAGVELWDVETARRYRHFINYQAFFKTNERLRLIVLKYQSGAELSKHPILIRLEQTVNNWDEFITPIAMPVEEGIVQPLDNRTEGYIPEFHIENGNLIQFPEHESPTSLDQLLLHPLDYTLETLVGITGIGLDEMQDVRRTSGNVAHEVIRLLCERSEEEEKIDYAELSIRIRERYDELFDQVIQRNGAILLLLENQLSAKFLKRNLRRCLLGLTRIMQRNNFVVYSSEQRYEADLGYADNTPIVGKVDMAWENSQGELFIVDFKWVERSKFYQRLLTENLSIQLSIYRDLVGKSEGQHIMGTGYFLMPEGKLYTTSSLNGVETIMADNNVDIGPMIANSYAYRKEQIRSGNIESDLPVTIGQTQYGQDAEERNLLSLNIAFDQDGYKWPSIFSPYGVIKESQESEE